MYCVQLGKVLHPEVTVLGIVPVFVPRHAKSTGVNDLGAIDCFISRPLGDDLLQYLDLNLRHSKLML